MWKLPIPAFDSEDRRHLKLAKLAARMQAAIEALELDDDLYFPARRRQIRAFIAAQSVGREIEAQVAGLLGST